jgi:VanZ family protein
LSTHQNKITGHLNIILGKLSRTQYKFIAGFWTALTIYLSLISAREASKFNVWDIVGFDKLAHLIFYTIFSFVWCMALNKTDKSRIFVLIFSICFGVLMEIFQLYLFNGRSFEVFDILANITGSYCGTVLFKNIIN